MNEGLVQVFASGDTVAGEMMRPAGSGRHRRDAQGGRRGPVPSGPVYVWVPAEDESAARRSWQR